MKCSSPHQLNIAGETNIFFRQFGGFLKLVTKIFWLKNIFIINFTGSQWFQNFCIKNNTN